MPPSLNKAQIRRLGERLCAADPAPEDLEALAALQDDYLSALESVDHMLRMVLGLGSGQLHDGVMLALSNRLKRDRRIIEKLRRGTELDRMQDIVGFRIVGDFSLSQQDDLTREVADHFNGRVKDRRTEPSYGYRAVHIVAVVDSFLVEVQVRTALQDVWAQHMESISDAWGRDLQYGGLPDAFSEVARDRRMQAVQAFIVTSPILAAVEEHDDDVRGIDRELAGLEESDDPRDVDRRGVLEARRLEAIANHKYHYARARAAIGEYNKLLKEIEHAESAAGAGE